MLFKFLKPFSFLHPNDSVPQGICTPTPSFPGKGRNALTSGSGLLNNTHTHTHTHTNYPWIPTPKPLGTPPGPACFAVLQLSTRRWQQRAQKRVSPQVTGAEARLWAGVPDPGPVHPPPGIHIQPGRPQRLKYLSAETVSDLLIPRVKTNI